MRSTCRRCQGQGTIIKTPCKKCRGKGSVLENKTVSIPVPAGTLLLVEFFLHLLLYLFIFKIHYVLKLKKDYFRNE